VAAGAAALVAAAISTALVALVAAILAAVAARAWQARHRADHTGRQLDGLTEGLGALAAELRSGRSLAAATDAAVAACASEECGRLLAGAVRAPAPAPAGTGPSELPEALGRISAAVLLSTRTGCSLAGVLAAVEDDLRARRRHRAELRSATAGPGASAMVLAGLPVLGLAMGSGVGADPWRVLTTTGSGQMLLVAGVALELAGLAWSRRLIQRVVR
jgi:tight adherence protein B